MKRTLFICSIFLLLLSCKNIISISKNEDAGIKDVLNFYGGYCEYAIGVSFSSDSGSKKYFELKLSKSEVLDKYADVPEVPASNAAYLFYNDLKTEAKKYTDIHVTILLKNGKSFSTSYSIDTLAEVKKKMIVVDKIVSLIRSKKFDDIKSFLSDNAYTDSAKNQLVVNLKKVDPQFGNVKEFRPFGFQFQTMNNYNTIDFLGAMIRDKQNNQFSLAIDMKPSEDKILALDYKFPF